MAPNVGPIKTAALMRFFSEKGQLIFPDMLTIYIVGYQFKKSSGV